MPTDQQQPARPATVDECMKALAEPFPPSVVHWRSIDFKDHKGKTQAAAYLDARAVHERLDSVLGADRWKTEYLNLSTGQVECKLYIRFPGQDEWIPRSDVGARSNQPDEDDALKACYSDALKRAAVQFGIGRYLYRVGRQLCGWDAQRKVLTETPIMPEWALPESYRDAGPQMADTAIRKVTEFCTVAKADAGKYVAEFLKACGIDPQRPLSGCSRRIVRALLRKVAADTEALPLPAAYPQSGPELAARLAKADADGVAAGRWLVGEMTAHVTREGFKAGFPADLNKWTNAGIRAASVWGGEFADARPAPKKKPDPAPAAQQQSAA